MLKIIDLEVRYGSIIAVHNVSMEVKRNALVAIVGPNGAGKSTTLKAVAGLHMSSEGSILYRGQDVADWPAHKRVNNGLILVPEGRRLFGPLSVRENLEIGAYHLRNVITKQELDDRIDEIYALFPILKQRSSQRSATLSGGEQEMLAIGRGLMSQPSLLLLDHPSQGLAPLIRQEIIQRLSELRRTKDLTILMVEQDIKLTLRAADYGYVMRAGRVATYGTSEELLNSPILRDIYLGTN